MKDSRGQYSGVESNYSEQEQTDIKLATTVNNWSRTRYTLQLVLEDRLEMDPGLKAIL
jgi:hypothetical protein